MSDQVQAQANPNGLMPIGAVAAHNIAAILNLPAEHIGTIETAIKDEINAMSSHFTLATADVQTQYEVEVAKIKADFVWVKANKGKIVAVVVAAVLVGYVLGAIVHFV